MFESNSSSTHSISITSKSKGSSEKKPIVVDGVIFPYVLDSYSVEIGYGGSSLRCETKDMKAAWLIQVIDDLPDCDCATEEDRDKLIETVVEKCGYSSADFGNKTYRWGRSHTTEYGDSDLSFADTGDDGYFLENLNEVIRVIDEVVLNDDIMVCDEDIPN